MSTPISITVRPRLGIDLGSNSYPLIREYLLSISEDFVLSFEKSGTDSHIQFGCMSKIRPDNIKRRLLQLVPLDETEKKHAILVKFHKDFDGLVGYCIKENQPTEFKLPNSLEYYNKYYIKQTNPYSEVIDYLTTSDDIAEYSPMERKHFNSGFDYRCYLNSLCNKPTKHFKIKNDP